MHRVEIIHYEEGSEPQIIETRDYLTAKEAEDFWSFFNKNLSQTSPTSSVTARIAYKVKRYNGEPKNALHSFLG